MEKIIYSIGHGNRKPEEFLALLKNYGIKYLIDVRSIPFSKFNQDFNQQVLKKFLENNGIKYVYMGDDLGGSTKDKSCYDENGKASYELIKSKPFFLKGIERISNAYNKSIIVALMCSEINPCQCHRSKLIGEALNSGSMIIKHIDEKGKLKSQYSVMLELMKGKPSLDLFGVPAGLTSRKSYL